mmetsp:Transcript_115980/g.247901  ORF Transcript_115980/g.247901 Transcript_115980/m.247901 type:complete len:203 (-) Transcript_115980:127-735(-)
MPHLSSKVSHATATWQRRRDDTEQAAKEDAHDAHPSKPLPGNQHHEGISHDVRHGLAHCDALVQERRGAHSLAHSRDSREVPNKAKATGRSGGLVGARGTTPDAQRVAVIESCPAVHRNAAIIESLQHTVQRFVTLVRIDKIAGECAEDMLVHRPRCGQREVLRPLAGNCCDGKNGRKRLGLQGIRAACCITDSANIYQKAG